MSEPVNLLTSIVEKADGVYAAIRIGQQGEAAPPQDYRVLYDYTAQVIAKPPRAI